MCKTLFDEMERKRAAELLRYRENNRYDKKKKPD